jgi:hypothetical protein
MSVSPLWFGPADRPLFGWFHTPPGATARAGAVLCAPFAREYIQAHYALRLTAEQLSDEGIAVLRFDYDGMGDSAGANTDPDRVAAWLRSTAAAIAVLRAAGVERVSLIGMRIGATLAARAAADDGGIDQLVLWDPCLSGRSFLREQQAVSSLTLGVATRLPDGSAETPGLVHGPDVVRDIRTLRLDGLAGPAARRVLVLTRPDRETDRAVMAPLGAETVDHLEATGQDELMDVGPPFQKLPYATVGRVADWVSKGSGDATVPVRPPPAAGSATVGRDPRGRPIVERPFLVPPAGLFGMMTEVPDAPADAPVALFLSVANEHHIGPDRLWVDLSRRWAGLGIRGLRLDLSGLGESPVRQPGQERFVARAPESFVDVADAARAVAPDDRRAVLLVGLCASAYQAIDSALDLGPIGVVAVNPVLSFVPPEIAWGLPLDPRRRAALPRNAVVGAFHDNGRLSMLRRRFPDLGWWLRLRAQPRRRPSSWLRDLVGNGTDVLIVAGEREGRPIRLGTSTRLLARLTRTGRFRFEYIPELEHGLLISSQRELVADLVTDHVAGRFAPRDAATPQVVVPIA